MSMIDQPSLRGEAVVLEPLLPSHVEALAAAAAESRTQYRYNPVPDGRADAERWVSAALRGRDAGTRLPYVILFDGRIVGSTSYRSMEIWTWPAGSPLQRENVPDVVEIGSTWLAASAQRTRCNTEAKYLLLRHAFEKWAVHRVSLRTDERNERSRRAIERLGSRFEGIRRADMPGQDGTVRSSAFYSIIRDEWPGVKERLAGLLAAKPAST